MKGNQCNTFIHVDPTSCYQGLGRNRTERNGEERRGTRNGEEPRGTEETEGTEGTGGMERNEEKQKERKCS